MKKENKIIAGSVAVGLVLGFGVGFIVWGYDGQAGDALIVQKIEDNIVAPTDLIEKTAGENTASVFAVMMGETESVIANASHQAPGKVVKIDKIVLDAVSWVAVHEDINGELGNVLGARSFAPGEYTNISVPLLRGTTIGKKYYVGVYKDNGDLKFDRKTDTLLRGSDGEMIGSVFMTQ